VDDKLHTFFSSNAASIYLSEKGIRMIIGFLKSKQTSIRKNQKFSTRVEINSEPVKSNETNSNRAGIKNDIKLQ